MGIVGQRSWLQIFVVTATATAALFGTAQGTALAADLLRTDYNAAPRLWNGFYIGLNAGGTWSDNDVRTVTRTVTPAQGTTFPITEAVNARGTGTVPFDLDGFIGGGQVGYNHQFGSAWILGIEADIQGISGANSSGSLKLSGVVDPPGIASISTITSSVSLDYLGTVRGRIGFLFAPTLLAYATGGLAYGGVETRTTIVERLDFSDTPNPFSGSGRFSDTLFGWTIGGGVGWKFAAHWSANVEYLFYDLGSANNNLSNLRVPVGENSDILVSAPRSTVDFDGQIVRGGLSYHFN